MMCPGFDVGALALLCLPKFCQDQNTFPWCASYNLSNTWIKHLFCHYVKSHSIWIQAFYIHVRFSTRLCKIPILAELESEKDSQNRTLASAYVLCYLALLLSQFQNRSSTRRIGMREGNFRKKTWSDEMKLISKLD